LTELLRVIFLQVNVNFMLVAPFLCPVNGRKRVGERFPFIL